MSQCANACQGVRKHLTIRHDQEHALGILILALWDKLENAKTLEIATVFRHQSVGAIERTNQAAAGQVRALNLSRRPNPRTNDGTCDGVKQFLAHSGHRQSCGNISGTIE